ncbi:hypothetical protein C8F04DRAFT_1239666 [Mycena alexandri]|uniref:DUF6535 domain-containing protein n=1 Tax=Mycena alexandri TaxID=1745969 RepID=A0AAD6SCX9_9AGAR|nr:hypothetical protein C8F04DRAFT_1239666 [Mycena alexandri]
MENGQALPQMNPTAPDKVKQRDDDPSENMWSVYMNQIEKRNRVLVECWRADMNSILIFAGLFSGSLTTFIVESYGTLNPATPDPNQAALVLALQLLVSQSNYTLPGPLLPSNPTPFVPPTSALICNTLWFLSLGFSLTCALSATLVDQWARNYILATESRPALHKRARISAYLHRGLRKFHMNTVVELIPTLLHISLLLFLAGLVEFLRPINAVISNLMLGMLLFCGSLYLLVTFLPIFYSNCPYYTPLSNPWWRILRAFGVVGRRNYAGTTQPMFRSMADTREADATHITHGRDQRDFEAMCWTLSTLREDRELEPFLGFIPQLVSGFDYSAKLLLHKLLTHGDPTIGLRYRIPPLLGSCAEGRLAPALAHGRATTCLHAIWSLTMMVVPLSVPFAYASRETLAFGEETLTQIQAAAAQVPSVADCADSVACVVARGLLDMFVDSAVAMEEELVAFVRGGQGRVPPRIARDPEWAARREPLVTKKVHQQIHLLEHLVASAERSTTPGLYMLLEVLRRFLDDLIDIVAYAAVGLGTPDAREVAQEAHACVATFQRLLNDAGLALVLDYLGTLVRAPTLPHEAFNTLRRLFLKINFEAAWFSACVKTQARLVLCVDEALEQNPSRGSHLPASIINIVLGLAGSALDDPGSAMKARGVIGHYLNVLPPGNGTRDEALKALERLDRVLPLEARGTPASDLLSAHMYANTKLDRKRTDVVPTVEPVLFKVG